MKRIPLSALKPEGRRPRAYALVDDEDYDFVTAHGPWTLHGGGYAKANVPHERGKGLLMHRLILHLAPGDERHCDHIDRNRLNNQQLNLRIVTQAANHQNAPSQKGVSSPFRGVCRPRCERKWVAQAQVSGRNHHLGYFDDELEAAIVAQAWRDEHMPFAQPDPALTAALERLAA